MDIRKWKALGMTVILVLCCLAMGFPIYTSAAEASYTALIISDGRDDSSNNDAIALMTVLKKDSRYKNVYAYKSIKKEGNQSAGDLLLAEPTSLAQLIGKAFQNAQKNSVSLFYFSGISHMENDELYIRMADDGLVSAKELKGSLDAVPGKKLVILDMSYAGRYINKGGQGAVTFGDAFIEECAKASKGGDLATSGYYVMASSSEVEESWSSASSLVTSRAMGIFTAKLVQGLGDKDSNYRIMADENINGKVTMNELMDYIRTQNQWTKAQMYPENSGLSIFEYKVTDATKPLINNVKITPVAGSAPYKISFNLNAQANIDVVVVAITYDPAGGTLIKYSPIVNSLKSGFSKVKAGVKSYSWNGKPSDSNTLIDGDYYFLIGEKRDDWTSLYFYPFAISTAKPELKIAMPSTFKLQKGSEMPIGIEYTSNCAISVIIYDASGKKVRTLAENDVSHEFGRTNVPEPNTYTWNAVHMYYWNGKNDKDVFVDAGTYTVKAQGRYAKGTVTKSAIVNVS